MLPKEKINMTQAIFNDIIYQIPRLRWSCRRGMLELDVLLGNFLEKAYPALPDSAKWQFVRLLECVDPALFAWLMGHEVPADPELAAIIEMIRHHARS